MPDDPIHGGAQQFTREQRNVAREYRKFKAVKPEPFRKYCFPDEYKVQRQQAFLGEYMDPANGVREMLAYHSIGAGKTCAAIQVANRYKRPLVILPASLIPGFRSELRSPCAGERYCTKRQREELQSLHPRDKRYKAILAESNALIDKDYTIMSYNKFSEEGAKAHDIIVIDEVHNMANADGTFYNAALAWITKHPKASVLIMTATPIFDSADELTSIAKLLRIDADIETPEDVERAFDGHVSYYSGAPSYTFPEADIRTVKLQMSSHQAKWYKSDTSAEMTKSGDIKLGEAANNFYANSRQLANVAFPRGLTGDDGLRALTRADIRNRIGTYSCKMEYMKRKLRKGGLSFIYSSYTGAGGIELITKCLRAWGWKDYFTDGPGKGRYVVWSGDTSDSRKEEIREVFNSADNDDASKIAAVIGSPSIKEGVSLLRVRNMHLFDLYWNKSCIKQIIGRVIRFCSHKRLPADERNVKVYMYLSYAGTKPLPDPAVSIDMYMLDLANIKEEENDPYLQALIRVAVDRIIHS